MLLLDTHGHFLARPSETTRVIFLQNKELTSRVLCFLSPCEVAVYNDSLNPGATCIQRPDRIVSLARGGATVTCACEWPQSDNKTLCSMLVCGMSDGQLVVYSALKGHSQLILRHPTRPPTRHHVSRAESRGRGSVGSSAAVVVPSRGSRRSAKGGDTTSGAVGLPQAVEDAVWLSGKELLATCTGDAAIFFWDLRRKSLALVFDVPALRPPEAECILCLATDPQSRCLVSSCDKGIVYVRDITSLPQANRGEFSAAQLVLTSVFRAHAGPITALCVCWSRRAIVTLGADTLVRFHILDMKPMALEGEGKRVPLLRRTMTMGYAGQRELWRRSKLSTFNSDPHLQLSVDEQDVSALCALPLGSVPSSRRGASRGLRSDQPGTSFFLTADVSSRQGDADRPGKTTGIAGSSMAPWDASKIDNFQTLPASTDRGDAQSLLAAGLWSPPAAGGVARSNGASIKAGAVDGPRWVGTFDSKGRRRRKFRGQGTTGDDDDSAAPRGGSLKSSVNVMLSDHREIRPLTPAVVLPPPEPVDTSSLSLPAIPVSSSLTRGGHQRDLSPASLRAKLKGAHSAPIDASHDASPLVEIHRKTLQRAGDKTRIIFERRQEKLDQQVRRNDDDRLSEPAPDGVKPRGAPHGGGLMTPISEPPADLRSRVDRAQRSDPEHWAQRATSLLPLVAMPRSQPQPVH